MTPACTASRRRRLEPGLRVRTPVRSTGLPGHSDRPGAWPSLGSAAALLAAVVCALPGCGGPLKPIFPEVHPQLVWPDPPDPPRIRYVGVLRSSADLKPAARPLEVFGDLFVGPRKPDALYGPRAAVTTPDGRRLWVADVGGRCLHVLDFERRAYRKVTRVNESTLLSPVDVCTGPQGSIFACDSEAVTIHQLADDSGATLHTLRIPEDVLRPAAVHWDDAAGELFVADSGAHDVKVLAADGRLLRILGRRGAAPGEFNFPCDIIGDGEALWVVDAGNHRVQRISRSGEFLGGFGQAGDALGDLALPKAVARDTHGHVYVVDARFENVQIFDESGRLLLTFGQEGVAAGQFWLPAGIHIDANNRIWVCDTYNGRIQVFDYVESQEP